LVNVLGLDASKFDVHNLNSTNQSMSYEACMLFSRLNILRPKFVNGKIGLQRFAKDLGFYLKLDGHKFKIPREILETIKEDIATEISWFHDNLGLNLEMNMSIEKFDYKPSQEAISKLSNLVDYSINSINELFEAEWRSIGTQTKNPLDGDFADLALKVSDYLNNDELRRLDRLKSRKNS